MMRACSTLLLLAVGAAAQQNSGDSALDNATEIVQDAAALTGVSKNAEGDLEAFLSALFLNSMIVIGCLVGFSILRLNFPLVYSHLPGDSKEAFSGEGETSDQIHMSDRSIQSRAWQLKDKLFDWVGYSINTKVEDAIDRAGLDATLLREYTMLSAKILGSIGIPLGLIGIPITRFLGGNEDSVDKLSEIEIANVKSGHEWLFHVHAVVVWFVCFVVHYWLFKAQASFLSLRVKWLENLPAPQCTTVMVEDIPKEWRSDERLREFFGKIFSPEDVLEAHMVKHADELAKVVTKRQTLLAMKRQAEATLEKTGKQEMVRPSCCASKVDALEYSTDGLQGADEEIHDKLRKYRELNEKDPTICSAHCGFVTFRGRRFAEMAQSLQISANRHLWQVSQAPGPEDIRWGDLRGSRETNTAKMLLGYLCVIGLYIAFLPIVITVTALAKMLPTVVNLGPIAPLWTAFAPTLGLTLFLSLLPSVMMAIFRAFFVLKAESYAQHKLQFWFFLFQLIFVVLVTAVGQSLYRKFEELLNEPMTIFSVMAENVPDATHFYMTYLVLQWATRAMEMLRYMNLSKFLLFKVLFTQEEAKQMSEPENQDSFGFGARSVNLTINLVLGVLFCSISPLVPVLAMLDSLLARLMYGYLVIYTESRKADLGGAFWVTQLHHVHLALCLFCVLMTGVLQARAATHVPSIIAGTSLLFVLWSAVNFRHKFRWQKLPFQEIAFNAEQNLEDQKDDNGGSQDTSKAYVQPEFAAAEAVEMETQTSSSWA